MQFKIEIPEPVARMWGDNPEEVGRRILEDAAVEAYRAGRLSQRQVGAMLGLDYWQTEAFLSNRSVPLNYSPADLSDDNFAALAAASFRALDEEENSRHT
jgi:predicted HTH domain antitoxin